MQEQDIQKLVHHETVMDHDQEQVGRLYGRSILAAAGSRGDEIVEQLQGVVEQCLTEHPRLGQLLYSPRVPQEQKEQMLDRIFRDRVDPLLLNFLKVLCRRQRINALRSIHVAANELRDEAMGRTQITVTSALPLSDEQRGAITERMGEVLGKQVVLRESVDPNLLGGIVIRVGDRVFDGSAAGRFATLRSSVLSGIQRAIRDQQASLLSS